ncbi:MAG: delta-60 repeat domain-containing protein [Minicystis sp.]
MKGPVDLSLGNFGRASRSVGVFWILVGVACVAGCDGGSTGGTGGGGAGGATSSSSSSSSSSTSASSSSGSVAECETASDCPDPGNVCVLRTCAGGACGTADAPMGTPLLAQAAGDCKATVCDGAGSTATANDDTDVPDDGNPCTIDACAGGTPSNTPAAAGAVCGAGQICDGNGACVACITDADCAAGTCVANACVVASCTDTVQNAGETDVDCGGPSCAKCADTKKCSASSDCASGLCAGGVCAQTTPIVVPLSATGHDRFHGVGFDAQGNILAVGESAPGTDANTDFSAIIARFSPAGVLDTTFGTNGSTVINVAAGKNGEVVRGVGVQSTGKIIVSGVAEHAGATDARDRDVFALRLNANGTLDTTFGTNGIAILNLSDGALVGSTYLADGAWNLSVYPDDRIMLSASKLNAAGTDTDFALVRLTANGAFDTTFATNGVFSIDHAMANANPRATLLLPDGSVLGSGYTTINGIENPMVFKVSSAGVLDTTFGNNPGYFTQLVLPAQTEVYGIGLQGSKIVTAGYGRVDATNESLDFLSLRLNANGKLNPTYGSGGAARLDAAGFNDNARCVSVLPDGRVLLAGGGRPTSSNVDGMVAIFTPNGQPDTTFSPFGWKLYELGGTNDFFWAAALAPSKDYVAVAGIKGYPTGSTTPDDAALLLVPVH